MEQLHIENSNLDTDKIRTIEMLHANSHCSVFEHAIWDITPPDLLMLISTVISAYFVIKITLKCLFKIHKNCKHVFLQFPPHLLKLKPVFTTKLGSTFPQ